MTKLKGVAHTFRVTNEDTSAITKTSADYWISGALYDQFLMAVLHFKLWNGEETIKSSVETARGATEIDMTAEHISNTRCAGILTLIARAR